MRLCGRLVRQRFRDRVLADATEFVLLAAYAPPRRLFATPSEATRENRFWQALRTALLEARGEGVVAGDLNVDTAAALRRR